MTTCWSPCGHPIQTVSDKVEAGSKLILKACGHPIYTVPDKVEAGSKLILKACGHPIYTVLDKVEAGSKLILKACGHPIYTVLDKVEAGSKLIPKASGHPIYTVLEKVEAGSKLIINLSLWSSHLHCTRQGRSRIKTDNYFKLELISFKPVRHPTRYSLINTCIGHFSLWSLTVHDKVVV